jgi:hypothetical protein
MEGIQRRRQVTLAVLAAAAATATDAAYLALIHSQDASDPLSGTVPLVSGYIAAIAVAALIGLGFALSGRITAARTMFLAAAAGSATLGFLAIFSSGLALLITTGLLVASAGNAGPIPGTRPWLWPVSCSIVAMGGLIAGFVIIGTF